MAEQSKELQISEPNNLISKTELEFATKVNEILNQTQQIAFQNNPIVKGLMQANAMEQINLALTTEMMKPIEKLFGSSIGIKTDKSYPADTMKRIFIEATLGGWGVIGNQINVIGGNMYITKNGYLPRLRKVEGLRFTYPFKHQIPVQNPTTLTWSITTDMEWTFEGKSHKETLTYPVKKQEGQSSDALWGKGDTKCCKWLWQKITGEETADDSGNFVEAEITNGNKGEGEKVQSGQAQTQQPQTKSDKGETIPEMINDEFQKKFDAYIGKEESAGKLVAKSVLDLINRAKVWCDSPTAKGIGVIYSISEDGLGFVSPSIDLKVFSELVQKFG